MATRIFVDGTMMAVRPKDGRTFSLEELQGFVGGYIEITYTTDGRLMVVNEEGKLNGLPLNVVATRMHRYRDEIVGDVLVCDRDQID